MKHDSMKYAVIVEPAGNDDEGFYAVFPDLPGCMGDGNTPEEAIADARLAFEAWMEVQSDRFGPDELPQPGAGLVEAEIERGKLLERLEELTGQLDEAKARIAALEAEKSRWPSAVKTYRYRSQSERQPKWSKALMTA